MEFLLWTAEGGPWGAVAEHIQREGHEKAGQVMRLGRRGQNQVLTGLLTGFRP